jgi:adenine-specific DNA-methyltransferase
MTTRHPHLFNLESGHSGLGFTPLEGTWPVFVQIGDENMHLLRALMDEVFGPSNFVSLITVKKTAGQDQALLDNVCDYVVWFSKSKERVKYRQRFNSRIITFDELGPFNRVQLPDLQRRSITRDDRKEFNFPLDVGRVFRIGETSSSGHGGNTVFPFCFQSRQYLPSTNRHWSTHAIGMERLNRAGRLVGSTSTLSYVRFADDFSVTKPGNIWEDTGVGGFTDAKTYVVQTVSKVIERVRVQGS